ncbi:MAG: tRNA lysidine(34) synthetase TilS [Lactobacillales bacterium]|nr:tRNA lysidine(34) synthetase TilS [Lactobacillales bacterium]
MENSYKYLDDLLIENDSVVVATSGGPDSMALLYLLLQIKEKKNIEIICAHVNHNTGRTGQLEEQEYVENYCKNNNINCETLIITNYGDDNFESEARNKRYEFFKTLIDKYKAKYLFTAHHGDDLIETILMRIVRGSTLKGYSGFSKVVDMNEYKIIRPLINVTKDEIIKFLEKNNIKYFVDSTNLDDNYTRNRYRKYILPKLKEEDKNVHNKFYKFSNTLLLYNEYIEKQVKNIIEDVYKNNLLDLDKFNDLEYVLKLKIIYFILENIYQDDLNLITDNHVNNILELTNSNKANLKIYLPNNLIVNKKYNNIEFKLEEENIDDYDIELIESVILPNNYEIKMIDSINSDSNYVCRLSKEEVLFPIRIRNRRDGDKMIIKGLNGSKKIKDIFINEKIDKDLRDNWPIVVDSNDNIVWLPGLKKSKFDKTKEEKYDIILKYQKKEDIHE